MTEFRTVFICTWWNKFSSQSMIGQSGYWKLTSDKSVTQFKFVPWKPIMCENQSCPTKKDIASRISLNGPQAIGATFGQSSVPIYICEACFHDSENNWSPNINLQKPMTTVQLECENRNCNHEENAEVGRQNIPRGVSTHLSNNPRKVYFILTFKIWKFWKCSISTSKTTALL